MNQLIQSPNKRIQSNKKNKTEQKTRVTGTIKMVNGVAVMMPPEEQEVVETQTTSETVVEKKQDVVTVEATEAVEEVQHVHDQETERQSNDLAAKVREQNAERAKQASIETAPKKVGNSIVAHSTSYDDIDLFAEQLLEKDQIERES